jgi:hypothetical protein
MCEARPWNVRSKRNPKNQAFPSANHPLRSANAPLMMPNDWRI